MSGGTATSPISATISDSEFSNSLFSGLSIAGNTTVYPNATITNTNFHDNGDGIAVTNAWINLTSSQSQNNSRDGFYSGIAGTSYTGSTALASKLMSNSLTGNGRYGVYLDLSSVPTQSVPYGHLNNISGNVGSSSNHMQMYILQTSPDVDWSLNYWGAGTSVTAPCPGLGRDKLVYLKDPSGNDVVYSGGPDYCGGVYRYYSRVYLGPAGSEAQLINGAVVPAQQTLGSGGVHAPNPSADPSDPAPVRPTTGSGIMHDPQVTGDRSSSVNKSTGNFMASATDLSLAGLGVPFELTRTYNSLDGAVGVMGPGWTEPYDMQLVVDANTGDVTLHAEDGQRVQYYNHSGTYSSVGDARDSLSLSSGTYTLNRNDQITYTFNSSGKLVTMKDAGGQGLTFTWTGTPAQMTSVTDSAGRSITFAYASSKLSSIMLPDSRSVAYTYNSAGQLSQVQDARGNLTKYEYDAATGKLTKELKTVAGIDKQVLQVAYSSTSDRVTDLYNALGKDISYTWNSSTQTSVKTDPAGSTTTDVYAGALLMSSTNPLAGQTTYQYDANFNVTKITDPLGHATTMTYDSRGNVLTRTAPAPLSYTYTYTYNSANQVLTQTDGRVDGSGHPYTTTNGYDSNGNLTSITKPPLTGSSVDVVTRLERDATTGQVTSVIDARCASPCSSSGDRDPWRTSSTYDATTHLLTSFTTPNGNVTRYSYDSSGRRTSIVDPRCPSPCTGTTKDNWTTSYAFNEDNQPTSVQKPIGTGTAFATHTNVYNDLGLVSCPG